jgi:hypothetical protein
MYKDVKPVQKFSLIIVFLVSLMSIELMGSVFSVYSDLADSAMVPSQGLIVYGSGPSGLVLKYSTDFENIVINGGGSSCSMSIQNSFAMSGSDAWMEGHDRTTSGVTSHSGTRCFGAEASGSNLRFELDMQPASVGVGQTFYVKFWMYLPSNWNVGTSDWYGMFQVSEAANSNWWPYDQFLIYDTAKDGIVRVVLDHRTVSGTRTEAASVSGFTLPRGQWFLFEWYEVRDLTNGEIKTSINGQVLWDVRGITTLSSASNTWHIEANKIYNAGGNYKSWIDDFEIYG